MYCSLCINSTVDGYLVCSQFLATVNEASINILGNIFWLTNILISLGYVPRDGIAQSYPPKSNVGEV